MLQILNNISNQMNSNKEFFSPCKVNLMLAITNPRQDGFHDLISLVAPTKFGDTLKVCKSDADKDTIKCNLEGVPCDESNLVIKAANLFREHCKLDEFFDFDLIKKVPHGAGLGGGSSNGAIALQAVNELCGDLLSLDELSKIAENMGADCPLFLRKKPIIMTGKGEVIEECTKEETTLLDSLKLLIFKPAFSINTGLAYKEMRSNPDYYISKENASEILNSWRKNPTLENLPLVNNMQLPAFKKFPILEIVIEEIKEKFQIPAMMSGSGSACFAVINKLDNDSIAKLKDYIFSAFGQSATIALG